MTHPIDTANDYVLAPLRTLPNRPEVTAAVDRFTSASSDQQQKWLAAYEKAIGSPKASFTDGSLQVPPGDDGPVAVMI